MSFDDIFLVGVEAGADDVEDSVEGEEVVMYTSSDTVSSVRDALSTRGLEVISSELIMKPIVYKIIDSQSEAEKAVLFLEKLEEHPDVQRVFANIEVREK
jgi:transcriptional/translational regulatory protein YebC/TACO1